MASLGVRSVVSVAREARAGREEKPLVLAGARELVPLLAKELRAGGEAAAVVEQAAAAGAAVFVWIGPPDEVELRRASRTGVPLVGLSDGTSLPYVLDTDLVRLTPGRGLPLTEIAAAIARSLGPRGAALAARLPALREAVIVELIDSSARRNGLLAAAAFVPGTDLPALTLNEVRLVLAVVRASGGEIGIGRVAELLAVLGTGFGSRSLARRVSALVPRAGFVLRGAIAFGATKAIGEAARIRFSATSRESVRPRT